MKRRENEGKMKIQTIINNLNVQKELIRHEAGFTAGLIVTENETVYNCCRHAIQQINKAIDFLEELQIKEGVK